VKNFAGIRAAMFKFVGTVSKVMSQVLEPQLKILSPMVLGCFNERDTLVHERMIEALVLFLKQYPAAWDYVQPWKAVYPRLFQFLRNTETSSPNRTYQTLVPFLSLLDAKALDHQATRFFDEFFSNFWLGYLNPRCPPSERSIVINSYFEAVMFVLLQAGYVMTCLLTI
jgi:hypothetical protein